MGSLYGSANVIFWFWAVFPSFLARCCGDLGPAFRYSITTAPEHREAESKNKFTCVCREWLREWLRDAKREFSEMNYPLSPAIPFHPSLFLRTFRCYLLNNLHFKQAANHDCVLFYFLMCFLNCKTSEFRTVSYDCWIFIWPRGYNINFTDVRIDA
jgi:hypothetical protein